MAMPKRSFHLLGLAAAVCMLAGAQSKTAAEGKPAEAAFDPHDLSGEWWAHTVRGSNFSLSAKAPAMTAWAQAKYDAAKPGLGPRGKPLGNDPIMICDPMGYPRILFWTNYPIEIIQIPGRTMMFFSWFYTYRTVWTDGRKLPDAPDPRWYGSSVGKWDGNTFVIDSKGFDERAWLDADGLPHSEDMTLSERFQRVNRDTIEITMTLTDAKAYTKPWTSDKITLTRDTEHTEMREDICVPSHEAQYKEVVRDPAGGAKPAGK